MRLSLKVVTAVLAGLVITVIVVPSTAGASSLGKNCGSVHTKSSGNRAVFKKGPVSCHRSRKLIASFYRGGKGWKHVPAARGYRKGPWLCSVSPGGGICRKRQSRAVIYFPDDASLFAFVPTTGSAVRDRRCGSFIAKRGYPYRIRVSAHGISCRKARRIQKSYWNDRNPGREDRYGRIHLRKFPGWRCSSGASAGGCFKGNRSASYANN